MQIRILAGCKRLMMVLAIASLIAAPSGAAAPASKGTLASAPQLQGSGSARGQLDDSPKNIEPVMYQRTNYVWPFSSGPVYASVDASGWKSPAVLHTAVGSFDLKSGLPGLPNELKTTNKLATAPSQYFLLQVDPTAFTDGTWDQMKHVITAHGGSIVGEIPVAAFVVKMTHGAETAIEHSRSLIALMPYPAAFKLSPTIGRVPLPDPVRAVSNVYTLALELFPGEKLESIAGSLAAMGATITTSFGDSVVVQVDRSKLADIAALDQVFMVNEQLPLYMFSEETTAVMQTGKWRNGNFPYTDAGVDGGGLKKTFATSGSTYQDDDQLLMVIDNGIQLDAADLSNTRTSSGFDTSQPGNVVANHRKVAFYGTTNAFGGHGDLLGCDGATTSGVTHGHTVAVTALGNATRVENASYGAAWTATDAAGLSWGLDGVAPKARLVFYDAQVTPFTGRCDDVTQIVGTTALDPGPSLYTGPAPGTGPLADGYAKGARISNLSWGSVAPGYDSYSLQIDTFLVQNSDAMIFVAAGNTGRDANGDRIPDPSTIGTPAAAKNIICVGASSNADDLGDPDLPKRRWPNSSNGPASPSSQRMAPLLMAPGTDAGTEGLASEFHCRSQRNDNLEAVSCDVVTGQISTSFASAAAAGAALLVRDYFAQGFYPDGTNTNTNNSLDQVSTISGALVKAILVASADWMNQPGTIEAQKPTIAQFGPIPDFFGFTGNLTRKFRGNREQGLGRIQLDNALPLQSSPLTVSGLIVGDGGPAPAGLVNSLSPSLGLNLAAGSSETATINVCDNSQPLTVVIAWIDPSLNDINARDLDLEVTSPSGLKYLGNFFTDDINDNGSIGGDTIDTGEECTYSGRPYPADSGVGVVDTGPWSLPSNSCKFSCSIAATPGPPPIFHGCLTNADCPSGQGVCTTRSAHADRNNNVEAVFLSPDTKLNGIFDDPATSTVDEGADNQIEQGAWTVTVRAMATNSGPQTYSIAIAGGVCQGSAARVQRVLPSNQLGGSSLTCNDSAVVTIDEIGTGGDPTPTAATVASRTTVQVIASDGVTVTDTETLAATDFTLVGSCSGNRTKACSSDPDCAGPPNVAPCLLSPGNNVRYQSKKILLTDGTTPQSGNGALDVRDGQTIRVTYQDANPSATRIATASVSCKPFIASGGVLFAQFGKDAFTLVDGGCERDTRSPVGFFTFGFPDRYMDDGELVQYLLAFQSAEIGTDLLNVQVSLKAVVADSDSPANCRMGTAATATCTDPNRLNNLCASSHPNATPPIVCPTAVMSILDSPKVYGRIPSGTTLTPAFTIQATMPDNQIHKVDMIVGVTASTAGKGVETQFAKREIMNVDEVATYFSTDFPTGGTESVGGNDINNNEYLESATYDPRNFLTDYFNETRAYTDLTSSNPTLVALGAPWNFDTLDGGFRNGLNNTSRPQPTTPMLQWSEDKNFNGRLDGFCTGDHSVPCTQGIPKSVGCVRCTLNHATECQTNADCTAIGGDPLGDEGTCTYAVGTCDFTLGEDRAGFTAGVLDKSWNTLGGCGWQSKFPGAAGGGVWHTGLIRDQSSGICVAGGTNPGKCQQYWVQDAGDTVGDNNWWDLLLTPELHKVRTCTTGLETGCAGLGPGGSNLVDAPGDPVYQVAITDWAWNMLVDIPDTNTSVTLEFDTDTKKTQGSDLFNDAAVLVAFRGKQGAISGGNAPITNGFNMFQRINHCVDTDGNGSVDHCGTAQGRLCNKDGPETATNFQCDGNDLRTVRGLCTTPTSLPALRCTGNLLSPCTVDADCNKHCSLKPDVACITATQCTLAGSAGTCINNHTNLGERCVRPFVECSTNADCGASLWNVGGTCAIDPGADLPRNREGSNNCYFFGVGGGLPGPGLANSAEPYGLPTPPDDDAANGYCGRSDGNLTGLDKSVSCISSLDCDSAGPPYASVRTCSLWKTCSIATGTGCLTNADCTSGADFCDLTKPFPCLKDSPDCGAANTAGTNPVGGVCSGVTYQSVCTKQNAVADEYVQKNGPGRNYGIQVSNGPDMRFSTLEDIYGDTGNDFQAALGFNNREPDPVTIGIPPGYGLAVDDMVISWKETRLALDSTTCGAGGECATLDSASGLSYEGNSVVSLTVIDKTPWEAGVPARNKNDCNGDGDYTDIGRCSSRAKGCTNAAECFFCSGVPTKGCATNADCTGQCSVGGARCNSTADCGSGTCVGTSGTCVTTDTCNADPAYVDDQDCDNNGANDVTVSLTSAAETTPEIAILNETSPGSHVFKANFPYSTLYNSPGTLFILQSGTALPVVTAHYADRDDGTGTPCKNAVDPLVSGIITSTTTVAATTGLISLKSFSIGNVSTCSGNTAIQCSQNSDCTGNGLCNWCDNVTLTGSHTACASDVNCTTVGERCVSATGHGDPDGFADAGELVNLSVVLVNKSGLDVDDITATLGTTSPNIECITRASTFVGSLKNKQESNPANYAPFQFKVKNTANRSTLTEDVTATFTLTIRSSKFDALTRATSFTIDLDFNASGGANTVAFTEDFENIAVFPGDFGQFTREFLDANKRSRVLSKGFRCQYNNPFGVNSFSASNQDCFLGFTADPSSGVNDWHIHTTLEGHMGRAFTGVQSLHLGVHLEPSNPSRDTTRLKHIMSIRTKAPVNIPLGGASPELNFAQQVSFVDSSAGVNVSPGECVDKGVVEVQRSAGGLPVGVWIKIAPFENGYDEQGTNDFSNCEFDPTDDGNTETDFFDPTDPNRTLGPSSTCFPEFDFAHQGQTDYRKKFDQTDVGNASDGPGLQGCFTTCTGDSTRPCATNADCTGFGTCPVGGCLPANDPNSSTPTANPGTWVRPRFSLTKFAAESIFIRFLFDSIEVGSTQYMDGFFGRPDISGDDGWYIDDIHIDQALDSPLTKSVDNTVIASPLACGNCTLITAVLDSNPVSLAAPGQIVTLTSKASTADRCINGILQSQFWQDTNADGVVGNAGDTLLRDWTDNSNFVAAPLVTTQYGVKVRCSTELSCAGATASNSAVKLVKISCPGGAFAQTIRVNKVSGNSVTIDWPSAASVDAIRGSLSGVALAPATKNLKATTPIVGFNTTVNSCLVNDSAPINQIAEATVLTNPGDGFYYLVRGQQGQKYTSGVAKERGGPSGGVCNNKAQRDLDLDQDGNACLPNP